MISIVVVEHNFPKRSLLFSVKHEMGIGNRERVSFIFCETRSILPFITLINGSKTIPTNSPGLSRSHTPPSGWGASI